ncbi:MAG: alpha/beta fold hydrolase [Oleiphilaceae bacterium]|nr:alpha/beta fold hydrolase [Oleiphilaceae bacterium]
MTYCPPWWLRNGHVQSIYPSLWRKLDDHFFERERVTTPDDDFLDLDWARQGHRRCVILTHGLEGHSRRPYMLGMAQAALAHQWDVLAWNFRSCSGEPNRQLASYHSGQTHDLAYVVEQALRQGYEELALIGFSIGGNKTLLYLGRDKMQVPESVKAAVVFSVPCDLSSSSAQLAKPRNALYMKNFMRSFKEKLEQKAALFPGQIDLKGFDRIRTFKEFDSRYTAPLNGFNSAEEYWERSSSKPYIKHIQVPTLLVSAKDDPFLTPACFPFDDAEHNPHVVLEAPEYGGHVGFMTVGENRRYWSEQRAMGFLSQQCGDASPSDSVTSGPAAVAEGS